jgi:hypothetical protein
MNQPDKNDKDYKRLWRIRSLFGILNDICAKFYNPFEVLEVIVQAIHDMTGCTYDMSIYPGKDRQNAIQMMTAAHVILKSLTRTVDGVGHKLYMYNFFPFPDLFDDLHISAINCCRTVRQSHKGMLRDFDNKTLELKY